MAQGQWWPKAGYLSLSAATHVANVLCIDSTHITTRLFVQCSLSLLIAKNAYEVTADFKHYHEIPSKFAFYFIFSRRVSTFHLVKKINLIKYWKSLLRSQAIESFIRYLNIHLRVFRASCKEGEVAEAEHHRAHTNPFRNEQTLDSLVAGVDPAERLLSIEAFFAIAATFFFSFFPIRASKMES